MVIEAKCDDIDPIRDKKKLAACLSGGLTFGQRYQHAALVNFNVRDPRMAFKLSSRRGHPLRIR